MGQLCQAPLHEVDKELIIVDLKFDNFSSKNDKYFLNEKANYINYLNLSDMLQFIYSIPADSSNHSRSYLDEVAVSKLGILIRNKIIRHPLIYSHVNEDDKGYKVFLSYFSKSHKFTYKNYKSYFKTLYNQKLQQQEETFPKICLFPLAFQFSGNNLNRYKVNIMFNLLAEDGVLKSNSMDLKLFLYFMFVFCTNITLLALDEVAQEDDEVRKAIPEEDFLNVYKVYETKDSVEAVDEFINTLFGTRKELNYSDFEKSLLDNKLYYIFSSSGTRHYLENRAQSS